MVDRVKTSDWDNILKLLMLTMLADGRVYEREVDSFVNASSGLRSEMNVTGMQTPRMSMEWYIEHRSELVDMQSGETFETDLLKLIDSLEIIPDKKALIKSMKNLARPELGRSGCTEGIIATSRQRWERADQKGLTHDVGVEL